MITLAEEAAAIAAGATFIVPSVVVSIAASADDARQDVGNPFAMTLDATTLTLNDTRLSGLRFQNVAVPQGATILSAEIQLTANTTNTGDNTSSIFGEDADDAAQYTSDASNISGRTYTTASASWVIGDWAGNDRGGAQLTPDISAIVQEIVDRAGWASGNAMAFKLTRTAGDQPRTFAAWDHATLQEAALRIEFTP